MVLPESAAIYHRLGRRVRERLLRTSLLPNLLPSHFSGAPLKWKKIIGHVFAFVMGMIFGALFLGLDRGAIEFKFSKTDEVFRREDLPKNQTFKIEKDLFAQWSRRQEVSNSTILGILERSNKDPCFSNSFTIPKDSLNGISRAIHRKIISPESSKALIAGVLGDSVAADHQGFVSALQSYLTLSPHLNIDVEI